MDPLDFELKFLENVDKHENVIVGDESVTEAKLADSAVTSSKLASGVVAANLGFTPASTGKAIAMAIVFSG